MPEAMPTTPAAQASSPSPPGCYFAPAYFAATYFGAYFAPRPPEGGDLESSIPGVEVLPGGIGITATKPGGNSAIVEYSAGGDIKVTLNGRSVVLRQDEVGPIYTVTYSADQRSQQGWDRFENRTGLTSSVSMYGGHNTVIGGSSWDFVLVTEGNNYVDTKGGGGLVYTYGGRDDRIVSDDHIDVYASDWNPYIYSKQ